MTERRPTVVLLISDKRSGSTMVQDEFCKHPDVSRVSYSPHTHFETQYWLAAAGLLKRPAALFAGGKTYPTYRSASVARTYLTDLLTRNLPGFAPPSDDRSLVFDGWEALCARFARPVFFEKSPQHIANWAALSLMLEWRERTTFSVKFLFLVRNPLAVQHSAEKLFATPPESRQFGWLEAHRNLLVLRDLLPSEDTLTVRYEDILADPRAEFGRICAFAGLAADPAIGSAVHARSADKWRDDPGYSLTLDPAVAQLAKSFGYGDRELVNPLGIARQTRSGKSVRTWVRLMTRRVRNGLLKPLRLSLRGNGH